MDEKLRNVLHHYLKPKQVAAVYSAIMFLVVSGEEFPMALEGWLEERIITALLQSGWSPEPRAQIPMDARPQAQSMSDEDLPLA